MDRDGVLNDMVIDAEHGIVDSPLHPDQVRVPAEVPEALAALTRAGFGLAIVSNQPAWAKGKTTRENLERVEARVEELAQSAGAKIASAHLCLHRREDACPCRKPRTGLLEAAFQRSPGFSKTFSWMVGDGVTDVEAGNVFGVQTAFVAEQKADVMRLLQSRGAVPTLWANSLAHFARILLARSHHESLA